MSLSEYTNTSIFHSFAWHSLTVQQQYRICVRYELDIKLDERKPDESKRSIYRAIANKFNYTMETIEKIANSKQND